MNEEEYEKLFKFEQFYWWHVGRRYVLASFLDKFVKGGRKRTLEIGCGTGGNLEFLGKRGEVVGLDVSEKALGLCRRRGFNNVVRASAGRTGFSDNSFDLVLALDVLEHVEKEGEVLSEVKRVLKEGGYFLITVPAYQFLWSEHDEVLHHCRRYLLPSLSRLLKEEEFNVVKISYLVSFVFPLIFFYRMVRKNLFPKNKKDIAYVQLPKFFNSFLINLLRLEGFILKYLNIPFGTSIICLAQKPQSKSC